jgi:hypothetical protein
MVDHPTWEICQRVAEVQTFEATLTSDKFKDWRQESFCQFIKAMRSDSYCRN